MDLRLVKTEYALMLLVLIPFVVWMGWRLTALGRKRRWVAILLRCLVLTLIVLALAEIHAAKISDRQTVIYILDDSDSMPAEDKTEAREYIKRSLETKGKGDRAGILVFAGDVSMEYSPQENLKQVEFRSVVNRHQTNIASALRLALAAFGEETQKRIVLISDGNETLGYAEEMARQARSHNAVIDIYPIVYEHRNDVVVDKFVVPNRVKTNEPFNLRVFVYSNTDTKATMTILRDGQPILENQTVELKAGEKTPFICQTQIPEDESDRTFHNYQVRVDPLGGNDSNRENNQASGFTWSSGTPRVLLIEGDPTRDNYLEPALTAGEIKVHRVNVAGIPYTYEEMLNYDSIIFNDVPAYELTQTQMKWIENAVHELGIGFVMVGGEHSFGAGGYQDTPIEKTLPVFMDIKQRRVIPKGALALVLHTCEFADGNMWARKIARAALDVLSSRDMMELLYYSYQSQDTRLFDLQEVGDKQRMHRLISNCQPGDMPSFIPTLQMAYKSLSRSNASVKHIVIISDGDATRPGQALIDQIAAAKISISTICINPHSGKDSSIMKDLAKWTQGNYYFVTDPAKLPQIFIKEATMVRQSLIVEETFTPAFQLRTEMMAGFGQSGWPQLRGYVATTEKPQADIALIHQEQESPILASWRYGIGKSVAFTSDASNRWAVDWLGWDSFSKFWSQVVRWSMRSVESGNYQMKTSIENGMGTVVIDAAERDDNSSFETMLIAPDLTRQPLRMRQVADGRWEGKFPADKIGTYLVRAQPKGVDQLMTGGMSMSYSPEFRDWKSNRALLLALMEETKGRNLRAPGNENVFERNLPLATKSDPIWPQTMAIALLLLVVDIFVRRVLLDWAMVKESTVAAWEGALAFFGLLWRRGEVRDETVGALLGVKDRVRAEREDAYAAPEEPSAPDGIPPPPLPRKKRAATRQDRIEALDQLKGSSRVMESTQEKEKLQPQLRKPTAAPNTGDDEKSGGMSRLMAAKKRALKKKK